MSSTSINFKDEGYTSPDFLTNLFKKPLYSAFSIDTSAESNSNREELKDIQNISTSKENGYSSLKNVQLPTSPLKFRTSPTKFIRSHSLIDDQKLSTKKFKIFFTTYMHQYLSEEEISNLWSHLEESMNNPFAFDKLIQDIKSKAETQKAGQSYCLTLSKSDRETNHKSVDLRRENQNHSRSYRSITKYANCQNSLKSKLSVKEEIKKQIVRMKQILLHGQRFVRQK